MRLVVSEMKHAGRHMDEHGFFHRLCVHFVKGTCNNLTSVVTKFLCVVYSVEVWHLRDGIDYDCVLPDPCLCTVLDNLSIFFDAV
jgi:hypothetical protein